MTGRASTVKEIYLKEALANLHKVSKGRKSLRLTYLTPLYSVIFILCTGSIISTYLLPFLPKNLYFKYWVLKKMRLPHIIRVILVIDGKFKIVLF